MGDTTSRPKLPPLRDRIRRMTDDLAESDPDLLINGEWPGAGFCAHCHRWHGSNGYLLCKPCWALLPPDAEEDLTRLWDEVGSLTVGETRDRQRAALHALESVAGPSGSGSGDG